MKAFFPDKSPTALQNRSLRALLLPAMSPAPPIALQALSPPAGPAAALTPLIVIPEKPSGFVRDPVPLVARVPALRFATAGMTPIKPCAALQNRSLRPLLLSPTSASPCEGRDPWSDRAPGPALPSWRPAPHGERRQRTPLIPDQSRHDRPPQAASPSTAQRSGGPSPALTAGAHIAGKSWALR